MPWKTCKFFIFFRIAGFLYFSLILNSGNSVKIRNFPKIFKKFNFFNFFDFFSKNVPFQARCFLGCFLTFSVNSQLWKCIKKSENFQNFSKKNLFFFYFFSKNVPFCTCCFFTDFLQFSAIFQILEISLKC